MDVYRRLARKLNRLPHGFPTTQSGVEIKILQKIFSPADAAFALRLRAWPQTPEAIAKRLKLPVDQTRKALDEMVMKGQIVRMLQKGKRKYAVVPFVVGIYEFQLNRMDKELADLVEEYFPTLLKTLGGNKPAVARVIPVNKSIDPRLEILPYENLRTAIEQANCFIINHCICRKERALQGHPCSHPTETCLAFSTEPQEATYGGRIISKEEALRVLDEAEREGLVHATYNVRDQQMFVCNCCSCCCGFLRSVKEFHAPYVLTRSNFVASIDEVRCDGCGICAEQRCPMDALELPPGGAPYWVREERCIGCGVCTVTCPNEAIHLVRRPQADQNTPPKNILTWAFSRLAARVLPRFGAISGT